MFLYEKGRYYQLDDHGKLVAEVTFRKTKDLVYALDHTWVDPSLRGQGIAKKLVDQVVLHAKNEGMKIDPVCPYALKLFESDSSYHDIWYKK